jgi:hypothetical protein
MTNLRPRLHSAFETFRAQPLSNLLTVCSGVALAISAGGIAPAQTQAKVTVNLGKELNILTSTSIGAPANMYDGGAFNTATGPYLKAAGIYTLRFPGNPTSADLYHWSTNNLSKYKGIDAGYRGPDSNFGNLAQLADKTGTAMVVVNYGTNESGTGGGEPAEAAAWVAYANGDPSNTTPLGKDSTGKDWQTVGYWATIRTQAPLATDDGYNFLRISRPGGMKIKLWQIGSQVYNNGYYGSGKDHVGEPDLHGPAPAGLNDFGKLKKNPKLSPSAYGDGIIEFAKAMKAVDPTIAIGASLVTPPDMTKWAEDWNPSVLKRACKDLDFVTLEWTVGNTLAPDYNTLDEDNMLGSARSGLNGVFSGVLYDDKTNCPGGHTPRIAFAPAGVITWPKIKEPMSVGLYVADTYALLVESGSQIVSWPDLFGDAMISNDRKKFGAVYYSLQMLHIVARNPGDVLVDAASNVPKLAVHATKRRDGATGIMLVNKDLAGAVTAKISISGGTVGTKAKRFDYGVAQQKAGTPVVAADLPGVGGEFSVTVPPYTITDLVITP